jgi:hypothetical protein
MIIPLNIDGENSWILIVLAHENNTHIILTPSQQIVLLHNSTWLAGKEKNANFVSFIWSDRGSNPQSTALEWNNGRT